MSTFCLDLQTSAVVSAPLELDSGDMEYRQPAAQSPAAFRVCCGTPGSRGLHLEQEKHELRRRLESREGEWEGRVAELETDVQQLQGELERHQVQLREADRDKTKAISELSEQNHRLLEQLSRAAEVEKQLSTQVHSLRDDFREKSMSTSQHMTRLETLQAEQGLEIKMLSERKMELERRMHAMLEENELLQSTVDDLRERTLVLEKQCHEKDLQ
ncbi:BICD family-like cargo adapter 1 isoform X3, partial [Lates japonicus]